MDKQTISAIEAILKRGNDAKVRRKGNGVVVIEIKETIKYSPPPIVAGVGSFLFVKPAQAAFIQLFLLARRFKERPPPRCGAADLEIKTISGQKGTPWISKAFLAANP